MSPIIKWLLARSQMQKAAIGGMDSAYRYRGPAAGSSASLTQQYNQNKEMAPFNQAGAAVTGFGGGLVQGARNIGGAINNTGAAMGDAVGTAYGALNNAGGGNGWKAPGSTPSMPAPSSPEAGRTPAGAASDLFGGLLPAPTAPYAGGGMGGVASTGAGVMKPQTPAGKTVQVNYGTNPPAASPSGQLSLDEAGKQVNQAMRSNIRNGFTGPRATPAQQIQMAPQTRIADDPTYRAPKPATASKPQTPVNAQMASLQSAQPAQPSAMHPSEQAKALREQMNKRQRDAAFGRGTFSPQERQKMMTQHEALIAQSNKMRNASGYTPDAASANPRDVADRARIQLNQQRSTAGGEVSQAPQVMQQINRLGRQYDAAPAQTQAQPPRGLPASNLTDMVAKTSSASMPFRFGAYIGQLSR